MRQTVGKVLAETTSCVNIRHPWSGIITKFIRMRIKIQILKGEVGPILYWLLLAGSTHQIIKFIIFSSSYLFQAAVCLVYHHHQYHEHRHHLHDHHQQHHKGWGWFPTMQHQAENQNVHNNEFVFRWSSTSLSALPKSSGWSTSTWCRTIPAR